MLREMAATPKTARLLLGSSFSRSAVLVWAAGLERGTELPPQYVQDWPGAVTYEVPINYAVFSKDAKRDPDLGFEFVEEVLCNLFEWMATKRANGLTNPASRRRSSWRARKA